MYRCFQIYFLRMESQRSLQMSHDNIPNESVHHDEGNLISNIVD